MKAHHLRELETTQQLNVEDLLHGGLELQHSADAAAAALLRRRKGEDTLRVAG